jgi:hypothetical protein
VRLKPGFKSRQKLQFAEVFSASAGHISGSAQAIENDRKWSRMEMFEPEH